MSNKSANEEITEEGGVEKVVELGKIAKQVENKIAEKHKHQDVFMAAKAAEMAVKMNINHREKLNALKSDNL